MAVLLFKKAKQYLAAFMVVACLVTLGVASSITSATSVSASPVMVTGPCGISVAAANVALYRPIPEGLPTTNAALALQKIQERAQWDSNYAQTIACQTGEKTYVASHYVAAGYSQRAAAGTSNSGVSNTGQVVPFADHDGSQYVEVVNVINVKTMKMIQFMIRCGNPRLNRLIQAIVTVVPWHAFKKGTVIHVNKSVSKSIEHTCPDGQRILVNLTTVFNETVTAETWGKVQGNLDDQLSASVNATVKSQAKVTCIPSPVKIKEIVHVKVVVHVRYKTVVKTVVRYKTVTHVRNKTVTHVRNKTVTHVVTTYRVVTVHRTVACPTGSKLEGKNCVIQKVNCPKGSAKNSAGSCVAVSVSCPSGYAKNSAGSCVATTTSCPTGYAKNSQGSCVAVSVSCPTGTAKNSQGQCVATTVSCPTGYSMNTNGQCVAQSNNAEQACATAGGSWDNETATCTITQVNCVCCNVTIIEGNGTTYVSQQGNCNTAPPSTTAPTTVPPTTTPPTVPPTPPVIVPPTTTTTAPPPPTTTTTAAYADIITVTQLNDVDASGGSPGFCAQVQTSGSGTVTFAANLGGFNESTSSGAGATTITFNVNAGSGSVCATFWESSDPSATSDSITVTLTVAGLSPVTQSQAFAIDQPTSTTRPST